ncbi:MAG: SDR family oxidoreductase [Aquisalimonadaceae bacterium]
MKRLLIAGCGQLGSQLGSLLAEQGVTVFGLRRNVRDIPRPINPVAADLGERDQLTRALPSGLNAVVYLATPGMFNDEAYRKTYVDGLKNLIGALVDGGQSPDRLLLVSSTSVYGQTDGSWVDENTPAAPGGFSGTRLLEAEQRLAQGPYPGVIVRFGGIYGANRTRMLKRVREGTPVVNTPPQYTNRIHQDDCVGVLAHLLRLPAPASLYLGVDDTPCTMAQLTDWLADTMGLPRPVHINGDAGGVRGSNKRCSNKRLRESGYRFRYPGYRQGYLEMLGRETSGG